jgi:hypothetical protein
LEELGYFPWTGHATILGTTEAILHAAADCGLPCLIFSHFAQRLEDPTGLLQSRGAGRRPFNRRSVGVTCTG